MADRISGLLGLMRKAGALEPGMSLSEEALKKGKAKLVVVPEDISEKSRERISFLLNGRNAVLVELPLSKQQLSEAVGLGECTAVTVTDLGFSDALMKLLLETDSEKYAAAAEKIAQRLEKVKRRKVEKPGKKAKK